MDSHPWDETEINTAFSLVDIGSASRCGLREMRAVMPSSTFSMRGGMCQWFREDFLMLAQRNSLEDYQKVLYLLRKED
jgi:hypothetical protein